MSLNPPSDYFCTEDAPDDFRAIAHTSDYAQLRDWCRSNPGKVRQAMEWMHYQHKVHREIIGFELEDLRQKELAARHAEIHERLKAIEAPHWTTTPVFWVTVAGAIAAGLAAYFGWIAIHPEVASPQSNSSPTQPPAVSPTTP